MTKSEEAKFWSKILGRDVASVYQGVPIIEMTERERAEIDANLRKHNAGYVGVYEGIKIRHGNS